MVFLDHGQNLHIHVVRANILMSFSVDFRSDRLIWPVCGCKYSGYMHSAEMTPLYFDCRISRVSYPV